MCIIHITMSTFFYKFGTHLRVLKVRFCVCNKSCMCRAIVLVLKWKPFSFLNSWKAGFFYMKALCRHSVMLHVKTAFFSQHGVK